MVFDMIEGVANLVTKLWTMRLTNEEHFLRCIKKSIKPVKKINKVIQKAVEDGRELTESNRSVIDSEALLGIHWLKWARKMLKAVKILSDKIKKRSLVVNYRKAVGLNEQELIAFFDNVDSELINKIRFLQRILREYNTLDASTEEKEIRNCLDYLLSLKENTEKLLVMQKVTMKKK